MLVCKETRICTSTHTQSTSEEGEKGTVQNSRVCAQIASLRVKTKKETEKKKTSVND